MSPVDTFLNTALAQQARLSNRQFAIIANALDEALEYFKQREDADHNGVDYVPNEAMRLALEIEQAQEALKALRQATCPACDDNPVSMRG